MELGRFPLDIHIKVQTLLYLSRLHLDNINPLLKESFLLSKTLHDEGIYTWFTYAKNVMEEFDVDFGHIKNINKLKDLDAQKVHIKSKAVQYYENLVDRKMSAIDETSKLLLYKHIKSDNNSSENFLKNSNFVNRKLITKIRISDHNLLIEKGRHLKIPREERKCKKCNIIDDEMHFIFDCKINSQIRINFIKEIRNENPGFDLLNNLQKISLILNPSTPSQVSRLGSFIKKSLELRAGDF